MRKTKFKIGDFFEYRGSIYKVTGIEFHTYGCIYDVKFIKGDEKNAKTAISSSCEPDMIERYCYIDLYSAQDRILKDLIRLVLKYHAENLATDFHTESEEDFIYRKIKENV